MPRSINASRANAQAWTIALTLAAAFIFVHPYTGVRHDGSLYLGDALARLFPGTLTDDLYFSYGSQGRFTLLPAYYAALVSAFGIGGGTKLGLLVAFSMYLAAAWFLVAQLLPRTLRPYGVLAVVTGWALYGGIRVFGYAEPFLTARNYAEPLVLVALGLLVRDRLFLAALAFVAALAVHPLIGLAGAIVGWTFLVLQDRRWWWAAGAALVVLVAAGIVARGPFADVFAIYDADWFALVREANVQAFVSSWTRNDYGIVLFDAVVLVFATRLASEARTRRFASAAVLAGVGTTLASLLLVDVVGNPFFGKLQIWRAEWIMQWTAMALFPLVLAGQWRRPEAHGRLVACFLWIAWMAPFSIAPAPLALMALAVDAMRRRFVVTPSTVRLVVALAALIAAVILVQYEIRVVTFGAMLDQPWPLIAGQFLAMNLLVGGVAFALIRFGPRLGIAAPSIALVLLVVALALWDQRGAWPRKLESFPPGTQIWPGLIEPDAKVYWYRDLIAPWILLGHGNYYTHQQASGAVFSRDMVVELGRRAKLTAMLDFQEQICRMMNNLNEKPTSCEPDASAVADVCKDGGIDYIVLQSTLEGRAPLANFSTGVVENGYEKRFYLYRCSSLKQG